MAVGRHIRVLVRALAVAIAMLVATPMAYAAPTSVIPQDICIRASQTAEDPFTLLANPAAFDCGRSQVGVAAPYTWALVSGLSLDTNPQDPWELRHEYSQADGETLFVRYTDGRMMQAPSDRMSARRLFSPGMMSFALPADPGRITAVLIRTEGIRNQRGVAPGIEFKTGRAAMEGDLVVLLLYGVLAGIVGALLIYNFALYTVLRYEFILCYCLSAVAMLFMGLCWSGGIFLFLPDLDTNEQISLTMLGTTIVLGTSVLFLNSFLERDRIPQLPMQLTMAAALVGVGSCVVRLIDGRFAWNIIDQISYWAITGILVGLIATAAGACWKGSSAARVYLIAWSVPIALGIARSIWAMGLIGGVSTLVAMSPLIFLALEAVMSALAVSWRVGGLRTERDEAHVMQIKLQHVADTDVLTGLLNRRAFIARALEPHEYMARDRLIIIDIDEFKHVNDRHGHQAGDDVLVAVAAAIRATAPPGALVGRLGGEEFAVLVAAEPVDILPEKLCRAVATTASPAGHSVTISIGVADGHIVDDASWRLVYHAADQALYRSKHGGRNRVSHAPRPLAA